MREVTFIIPCAGKGSRLGLPFPKELAPLGPGRAVIDSCLDLIGSSPCLARIIVMDDGQRDITAGYIQRRFPGIPLARVRQDKYAADWPDGVLRLEPWLGPVNILVLPDAAYAAPSHAVEQLAEQAQTAGIAFGAARMSPEVLRSLGALAVAQDDTVRLYEDKPSSPERYNAAWGLIGFSGKIGLTGMRVIADSTRRQGTCKPPVAGAPVTWLDEWRDLGTWESYSRALCAERVM